MIRKELRITAPSAARSAFSLVELSIVLVILGLLVGGILAGKSLIRAGELRAVGAEQDRYRTAVHTFRDKYFMLPGDMTNATSFWGAQDSADGLGVDCTAVSSTTALTCNGSGNSRLGNDSTEYYELFRFWQHLVNAGLIEGQYSGVTGGGSTTHCTFGTNCPSSKLPKAGWGVLYSQTQGLGQMVTLNANAFFFGAYHATNLPLTAVLLAEEAWNIDTKVDDGKPGSGRIITNTNTSRPNCADSDTASTAIYQLSNTTVGCNLIIRF